MPDDMPEVMELHAAYRAVDEEAALNRERARARLGRAIDRERQSGTPQGKIAARLDMTREQVRRHVVFYREWLDDHPGESLDD